MGRGNPVDRLKQIRAILQTLQLALCGLWLLGFVGFVVVLAIYPKKSLDDSPSKLGPLAVYQKSGSYAEVDRQKAVEFSLDKVASVVNYLLLAAAGVLAFSVKFVTDQRAELAKAAAAQSAGAAARPSRVQLMLFLHGGIACFFSLVCGVAAYLYLPGVATAESFSIYNEVGICVMFQLLSLLGSLFLLLLGLADVLCDLMPPS
jgi:hypothetical protein